MSDETQEMVKMAGSQNKWLCIACHFLLGIVEGGAKCRIKRKDLYLEIEGGKITINCCRCGKINTLVDDKVQGEGGTNT